MCWCDCIYSHVHRISIQQSYLWWRFAWATKCTSVTRTLCLFPQNLTTPHPFWGVYVVLLLLLTMLFSFFPLKYTYRMYNILLVYFISIRFSTWIGIKIDVHFFFFLCMEYYNMVWWSPLWCCIVSTNVKKKFMHESICSYIHMWCSNSEFNVSFYRCVMTITVGKARKETGNGESHQTNIKYLTRTLSQNDWYQKNRHYFMNFVHSGCYETLKRIDLTQ